MGFYATDERAAVLEPCQENLIPPSKNRVWNFFTTTETCTGFFESQPVESHQEKWPTPTTTVSGVRYYGHRFYMLEIGRWASRDPMGEQSVTDYGDQIQDVSFGDEWQALYLAFQNNPFCIIDILGLLTPCQEWAATHPADIKGVEGGVVCKDGKKYACSWSSKKTNPGIVYCLIQHEKDHFDDVDCPPCGLERPPFKKVKDQDKEECHAYTVGLACVQKEKVFRCNKLKGPAKKKCQDEFDVYINFYKCTQIPKFCKTPKPAGCP